MRYMTMVKSAERTAVPPKSLLDAIGKLGEEARKAGVIVDAGGLKPTAAGARLLLADGKIRMLDGPFSEAKEVIGGYAVYQLTSKAEAIDWARRFLQLHIENWPEWKGEVEIREMYEPGERPGAP